jgi:hypothetical protein
MTELEALKKRVAHYYKEAMESATIAGAYAQEAEKLRAFAQGVMRYWPEGAPDGGDLQELAEKHELLKPETRHEPCEDGCACAEYADSQEWERGVTCYRKTRLLLGSNDRVEGRDAALSRRVPSHDGLAGKT